MQTNPWHLGQTSERYETGGRGPGTISHDPGDPGGASYGLSQFSLNTGSLQTYLVGSRYKDDFKGLEPGSPAFDAKWRAVAKADPMGFAEDQHEYTKVHFYDTQSTRLKTNGLNFSERGPAVQDAVWSTSVQFGNLTTRIFENGIEEQFGKSYAMSKLSDKDIVEAVQDYKITHNDHLFRHSSAAVKASVLERAREEKKDLLALTDGKTVHYAQHDEPASLKQGSHGHTVETLQADLAKLGYTDARGQPLKVDGEFGIKTRHVVECLQHDHHLVVDGIVGQKTQHALSDVLYAHSHKIASQPQRFHNAETALCDFSHPTHPQHALYASLKERLPTGTSEPRLAQVTAACHKSGMNKPEDVGDIHINATHALLLGNSLGSTFAEIDLTQPVPSVQQSVQQAAQYDRQMAQIQARSMQPDRGLVH